MTRVWKMIAMAASAAYLLQATACVYNPWATNHGMSWIPNISTTNIWQYVQQLLAT